MSYQTDANDPTATLATLKDIISWDGPPEVFQMSSRALAACRADEVRLDVGKPKRRPASQVIFSQSLMGTRRKAAVSQGK